MGSSNSKEKELDKDLERIRKDQERIAKERAERTCSKLEVNSTVARVVLPLPGYEVEINAYEAGVMSPSMRSVLGSWVFGWGGQSNYKAC